MDMSKYREMFLTESREHLKNMSRLILALEQNPSDAEGIDSLFREAHSVKGMAASMGYDRTAELAHNLEDLMDGFRSTGTVPAAAVDRLLDGLDLLEGLLEDLSADQPEREIAAFIEGASVEANPEVAEATLVEDPEDIQDIDLEPEPEPVAEVTAELDAAPAEVLNVTVELAVDAVAPSARALLLLRELSGLGEFLDCRPTEEELRKGGAVPRLEVKLRSGEPVQKIEKLIGGMPDIREFKVVTAEAPQPEPASNGRGDEGHRTVRIRTDLLDKFINLTGELITTRYMLQGASRDDRKQDMDEGLNHLSRLITDLHHHVLQVRMMPLESITGRLPRLVRDLCRKTDKQVRLSVEGEDVELDRAILEALADPLVHMVRNAIDHGIEQRGEVRVRASREKDLVQLEVADNGRGMDPEAIRQKALSRGLISPSTARTMRDRDLLQLVCQPGFSTAAKVTETSGRGVGMDVVKSAVENLGGTLEIASEPGKGSRILLKLPLSVAIIQVLLVASDGKTLGIPITRVLRTLEVPRQEVRSSGRQLVIPLGDELVPLLSLRKILHQPGRPFRGSVPVVVTEIRGRKVGLVVDQLVGQREAFVKSLAFPLDRLGGVSGATVLGDGSVVFIIDPSALLEERSAGPAVARATGGVA